MQARRDRFALGGAANVARNLEVLGCDVRLSAVVGKDADGEHLISLCRGEGLPVEGLVTDPQRKTTKKTRVISRGHHLVRVDWEEPKPLSDPLEERFAREALGEDGNPDVLVLSDYGKGMLTTGLLRRLIAIARKEDLPILVDPKGRDFARYAGATLLTPNRAEAEEYLGFSLRA
ncbi:MAG: bifunctional heptose 7-phosphate kinase/heptose 1-phosphate adenyltransferase, partial [Planctomycetota bacterium]